MRLVTTKSQILIYAFIGIILPISFSVQHNLVALYLKVIVGILGLLFYSRSLKTNRKLTVLWTLYCLSFILPYLKDNVLTIRDIVISIYPVGIFCILNYITTKYKKNFLSGLYFWSCALTIVYVAILLIRILSGRRISPILTTNRNSMQIYFAILIAGILLYVEKYYKELEIKHIVLLSICALGTFLSGSATGIMSIIAGITLLFFHEKVNFIHICIVYIVFFIVLVILRRTNSVLMDYVFDSFEKSRTFTGRAWKWDFSILYFTKNPVFGTSGIEKLAYYYKGYYDSSFNSHNALLSILLQSGCVGFTFLVLVLLTLRGKNYRSIKVLFSMMIVTGLMESNFGPPSVSLMLLLTVSNVFSFERNVEGIRRVIT